MSINLRSWLFAIALLAVPALSFAQTDEIQVYDAEIAEKGTLNLMIHSNFTPDGRTFASFPGGEIPNHSDNGAAEWAYGVTDWFEAGFYMPLYSFNPNGAFFNGYKFRALFVKPHAADQKFFYGLNFEFSFNQKQWDPREHTSEIRPIIGWHLKPIDLIVNPIVDNSYLHGIKGLDFAPSARVAYNFNETWALAAEEYADYGTFRDLQPFNQQFQELWATVDRKGKTGKSISIETGIGFGLTSASDKVTLKLMVSRDLN